MSKRAGSSVRKAIRETANKVVETYGNDPEVARHVEALIGSLDDTLPDDVILEELRCLAKGGMTFVEVFASNAKPLRTQNHRLQDAPIRRSHSSKLPRKPRSQAG
jgi:hypothetical protein